MKRLSLFLALTVAALCCEAQDSASDNRGFHVGGGAGVGLVAVGTFGIGLSGHIQGEYYFTSKISAFISSGLTLIFGSDSRTIIPIQAGPRYYFTNEFFAGVGVGDYLTFEEGVRPDYTYYPHIGYNNSNMSQITLGLNVFKSHSIYSYYPVALNRPIGLLELRATLNF